MWNYTPIPNVKKIIAIASGKGGVGKSAVAVGLAFALRQRGLRVGIMDADICGPSLPLMLGITERPEMCEGVLLPIMKENIACMSVGFLLGDAAAVMRGPLVSKTLNQFLRNTHWGINGELDVLIVDTPPGTGDIQLSLMQQAPLGHGGGGVIIVTTPQKIALEDVRRAVKMYQKVNIPILGVIENMSGEIFGTQGGKQLAEEINTSLLGSIALDADLRKAADNGDFLTLSSYFNEIAEQIPND